MGEHSPGAAATQLEGATVKFSVNCQPHWQAKVSGWPVAVLSLRHASYDAEHAKMTTARSVRFFVSLGLGLVFYGLLLVVKL